MTEAATLDWNTLLPPPRDDQHARYGSKIVHRERQELGLCGFLTRCGHLWGSSEVEFTDDPVTCKTCLRASP